MTTHPLHALFGLVDTETAADGTALQREMRCCYCAKTWRPHKHSTGERLGKWRAISFGMLREHMLQECNHNSDDILSVARAASKDEANACVARIRAHNRCWPPPATVVRDPLAVPDQVAGAASQSLIPRRSRVLHSASTLQPDRCVDSFADDMCVSPSKRRRITSDAMLDNGSSAVQHNRRWVYLMGDDNRPIADWDAADVDAWRRYMPWGESDNERFNTLLGKLVCTAGCAIRVVASGAVRALAQMVHPRCILRSAATFARRIIPVLAQEAQAWNRLRLHDAKYITLQTDIWTTARGRSVCAHLAVTEKREVVIVHAPERTGVKHDAKMIAQDMQETIAMVDAATVSPSMPPDSIASRRSKVVAVVTDAASCNTSAMSRLLPLYPGLRWETCNIHRMNNLLKKLCSFAAYEELLRDAQGVVVAVTRNSMLNSLFAMWRSIFHQREPPSINAMCEKFKDASKVQWEAIGDLVKEHKARYGLNAAEPSNTGLVSAVETRFASHVSLLDSLAHNRPVLQLLATCYPEHFRTSNRQQARQFIGDKRRWKLLDDMLAVLQPIRDAIVALEADDTTLGTAYHYWLVIAARLQAHVTNRTMSAELREHIIRWTDYYWEQLPHDLMATALLLHPHLRDRVPLRTESKRSACAFVYNYILQTRQDCPDHRKTAEAVTRAMFDYIMRSGQFARPAPAQGQSDIEWWRRWVVDGSPVGDAMMEMVERLHSIPPHTAAVERFYSRLGFMQRPHRSHLSVRMLVDMAMINTWLVATDPLFDKPPRAASRRIATHASGDGQGHATTDSESYISDGDEDGDDDAVLCEEDNPADGDDAAATASNSDNESLVGAESAGVAPAAPERPTDKERLEARVPEDISALVGDICDDLTSPILLAGIHGSSIAQEAPSEEVPQTCSESNEATSAERGRQIMDELFPLD
jgi:Protein of unknown function (DUF 659)